MSVRTIGRRKITVTIPDDGLGSPAPIVISATALFPPDFEIHFPTTNTSAVGYLGDSTVDNTWIPRTKGISYSLTHGDGNMDGNHLTVGFNLAKLYVYTGTIGDKCIIEYMAYDKS